MQGAPGYLACSSPNTLHWGPAAWVGQTLDPKGWVPEPLCGFSFSLCPWPGAETSQPSFTLACLKACFCPRLSSAPHAVWHSSATWKGRG